MSEASPPSLAGVQSAQEDLRPFLDPTPLVRAEALSAALKAELWLKIETVSPIGSFKARGALVALLRASRARKPAGAVTSSTGNHGQGVAFAARALGVPADIFLPAVHNPAKRRRIEELGGILHVGGRDIDAAKEAAKAFARERQAMFVDDGESLDVMEGAGTVGLEVARRLPDIHTLIVPMGSGSLASGCAAAAKAIQPGLSVWAVQSEGSPAMTESYRARRPVERPVKTLADGLVCRVPARRALEALWRLVDDVLLVSDARLLSCVRTLMETSRLLAEPSGAAALAAAWERRHELRGRRVVLVLTGANITMELLDRALRAPSLI